MKSPRTTVGGIIALAVLILNAVALLVDGDPATSPDWGVLLPAAIGFVTFLFARDQAAHDKGE